MPEDIEIGQKMIALGNQKKIIRNSNCNKSWIVVFIQCAIVIFSFSIKIIWKSSRQNGKKSIIQT